MPRATFRFYAELNDFLPPSRRGVPFAHSFLGRPAVKDAIEALGVPHTEVDLVLLDGESVDFRASLYDGARVSVFPVFESIDVRSITCVRPEHAFATVTPSSGLVPPAGEFTGRGHTTPGCNK